MLNKLNDIESRKDIDELVSAFYAKALHDPLIGYIFTDVAKINLENHLPIIADFWESIVFQTAAYHGRPRTPMQVHMGVDDKEPLKQEHFVRWLELFAQTIDKKFSGENADFVKERSRMIGANMLRKIEDRSIRRAVSGMCPVTGKH